VRSRDDFGDVVQPAHADFVSTGGSEWENPRVDRFLEALGAFAHTQPHPASHGSGKPAHARLSPSAVV
jgi:hypothetical protein